MHVLILVANSTLLNYIRRNYRTVLRAGIVGMVLTRQRTQNNQRLNVTAKRWGGCGRGGGGALTEVESDAFSFRTVFFMGCMKRCSDPLS